MNSRLPCLTNITWVAAAVIAAAQAALAANALAPASPPGHDSAHTDRNRVPSSATATASTPADLTTARSSPITAPRITAGDQLLLQAIAQLERHESVAARLQYRASIHGQTLANAGSYWQQGRGDSLRVRLELRITDEISLLQVSNGRLLWTDRQLPTGRSVTRLDLGRIRADAARAAAKLDDLQPGQANWSPFRPELTASYGGLPKLLAALSESFTFQPPQAMRFKVESADRTQEADLPVFAVVGHWKRASLARMLSAPGESAGDDPRKLQLAALPPRIPQEVLLLVGQADLFPYRIEYRKRMQHPPAAGTPSVPYRLSMDPLALVVFSDVSFDVPIGPGQFDYAPSRETEWDDLTAEYVDKIRRRREEQLAARDREPAL